jgi:teichuronic acid exporter
MLLRRKALSGFIWSLADKLINQLGNLAVFIYLSKIIGPSGVGLVGLLFIFSVFAQSVVDSGFFQALVQKSTDITEEDLSTIFYVNLLVSFFIYGCLFFLAPYLASFYHQPELIDLSRIFFLIIIFNGLTIASRAKLTIVVDFKSQMIANLVGTIIASIVAIIIVLNGYGYWSLAANIIVKILVTNIVIWMYAKWLPKLIFSKKSFKSLFNFGSKLLIGSIVSIFVNNAHAMLIGRFYSIKDVGIYNQANTTTTSISSVFSSTLQSVTFPILTSIKNNQTEFIKVYKKLSTLTLFISIPAFIGLISITTPLVKVFLGEEWIALIPIFQIFCLNRLMTPIAIVNINILNAVGRSDLAMKLEFYKLPFTLGTLILAIPFGVVAVAWAAFLSTFIAFFINTYYQKKLFNFGAFEQIKISTKFFVAAIIMYLCNMLINLENSILEIFIKVILGIVIYITMLLVLKDRTIFMVKDLILGQR